MDAALVFAGGDAIPRGLGELLDRDRLVIAADSGLDHAHSLGFHADLVVGDLDSVDPDVLRAAREQGTEIELHPAEKDSTDLDLALEAARARGAIRVTVVGGNGGRLDHLLANVLLLAAAALLGPRDRRAHAAGARGRGARHVARCSGAPASSARSCPSAATPTA